MGKLEDIENKIKELEKDVKELKCYFSDDKIKKVDEAMRTDKGFWDWIEGIKKEKLKRLIDTTEVSSREITSMIPKHKSADKMREDLIKHNFKKDNGKKV